jgi:drug/metabolite transporter (DMT)-like permease
MASLRLRADLALVLCTAIWGVTFVIVKDALADVSVLVFLAVRFGLASLVMVAIFWGPIRRMNLRAWWAGAQIGLAMFGGFIFQTVGLRFTTPSKAAFLTGCCVVIVPFLSPLFGEAKITPAVWSAALLTLAGLYFLAVPSAGFHQLNRGDALVFIAAVCFAFQIIFITRHVAEHPVAGLSFVQVLTAAVLAGFFLPLAAASGWERPRVVWNENVVSAILITSIAATVIALSIQVWAQKHTTPSHAGILFSLEPVFAAITSLLLGRERLGQRALAGAALILFGIIVAELKSPAPHLPESTE